jgi:hypothetical protein
MGAMRMVSYTRVSERGVAPLFYLPLYPYCCVSMNVVTAPWSELFPSRPGFPYKPLVSVCKNSIGVLFWGCGWVGGVGGTPASNMKGRCI